MRCDVAGWGVRQRLSDRRTGLPGTDGPLRPPCPVPPVSSPDSSPAPPSHSIVNTARSAWIWGSIGAILVGGLPLVGLTRLFDRDPARYRTGRMFRRLGAAMTRVNPGWEVEIEGAMPDDPRAPYVVICNHQSNADIPVVSRLPWEMKWVGKAELFRLPVAGWLMKMAGDIPVERGNARSRASVMIRGREVLGQRCSVIFFPEGTRSRDGRLLPFNDGAFRLAIKVGVPILPLALDGTMDALPKDGWRFGAPSRIRLAVLAPIDTTGLASADAPALRERTRHAIATHIAAWRGTDPTSVLGPTDDDAA